MEKKIFTDKQQLATGFACSSRTVSPDEHCYRLICASCTQFHVPLGTQAFQLPQAASKQRSVPWCCRCGMFAAFTTAAIRLLRSIFIWAPPRTRPKFQHLCAHTRDSQRSRCSARRCNISRLPLSSKHVLCFWFFFDIFQMMMTTLPQRLLHRDAHKARHHWVTSVATHSHNSMQRMCSSNPETTTPAFDKRTSLSHRRANWTVKLTMNISIPTQITTPNEPSSARPSTDTLACICTLNLWQFHVVR